MLADVYSVVMAQGGASNAPTPTGRTMEDSSVIEAGPLDAIPGLHWTLLQVGVEDLGLQIESIARRADLTGFLREAGHGPSSHSVVEAWTKRTEQRLEPHMLELLLFDYWISTAPHKVSQLLPGNYRFDKTLHTIQQLLASTLYEQAKDVTWARPFTMCRALQLSKIYFKKVLSADYLVGEAARPQFLGKYAVATALRSRHT